MNIQEIKGKIKEANEFYRLTGEIMISDEAYDTLVDKLRELSPEDEFFDNIGIEIIDEERKETLPVQLWSMEKIHDMDEVMKWTTSKDIPLDTLVTITPKYDGISLCVVESKRQAWTRGNGIEGQRSHEHFSHINTNQLAGEMITWGEAIIPRDDFDKYLSEEFKNPRNLVAGKFNDKTPKPELLKYADYVRYGLSTEEFNFKTKSEQLDYLNQSQRTKVPYEKVMISELSADYLKDLFIGWSTKHELDGVIIEVDDLELQKNLGRERNNNPVFARAYKGEFEEVKESKVRSITVQVSKRGYLKPVVNIEPIELDGVTVSNPTGYNFKFIKEMGIGVGAVVKVKRSGMVIPKIIETVESVEFEMPDIGVPIEWNETGVELVTLEMTDTQKQKQIESFFKILDVDNVGEGVVKQIYEGGFDTIKKVLSMSIEDFKTLDRFGAPKAKKVYNSIHSKLKDVTLSKFQHASGLFENLGSKKLLLLEHLNEDSTVEEIEKLEGFSEISANSYLKGIVLYNEFYEDLKEFVTVNKTEVAEAESDDLDGMAFVFSGVRRKDLNEIILSKGGRVASGVSKNSTHLVMKTKGTGSAKENKALGLGQTILTVNELEELLGV
ncbi:MAG: DNA ligase [uncultured marine phage]|uniref:DNA ligase (NAD(+)) n=1 Tax=uncultured marine phage TaxID=707152 RepID=A0A8D9C8P7_9VIRU|nr:MAG: DNA ligase [uncultured marine phage]